MKLYIKIMKLSFVCVASIEGFKDSNKEKKCLKKEINFFIINCLIKYQIELNVIFLKAYHFL